MDLKELNYIVTVAAEGSISRAAEKLYMAQSSLSQSLRNYEAELGTPIFVRTAKGVRTTAAGEAFLAHARQILQQYHLAQSEVWDIEGMRGGWVELGVSTFRGTYLLPPVLKRFYALYPNVHVEITEMDSYDLENQILEGLLDIALVVVPTVKMKHNIEPLLRDEFLLVTTADHPVMEFARPCKDAPQQLSIALRDTALFEYNLGPSNTVLGRTMRQELLKCGIQPLASNKHMTASFAAAMARNGVGLAVTYRSCMVPGEQLRYLRMGEEGVFLDLALAYPVGEYRSNATKALAKLFHEVYDPPFAGAQTAEV